jgi:hypothetical protein
MSRPVAEPDNRDALAGAASVISAVGNAGELTTTNNFVA